MNGINWQESLGWTDEQIDDLRQTAYAYIRQGKYDIAITFFEALNVLKKDSAYDAHTLGALYLQTNLPEKAIPSFQKALKLEPKNVPALLNLAKAYFILGKTQEGLKIAEVLKDESDQSIASVAKALILAHS